VTISFVLVVFIGVALWLSEVLNIWVDEAYTLHTTGSGIGGAVRRWRFERQAPLYFILLSLFRLIDDSILFARSFSVLAAAGFVILITKTAKTVSSTIPRWVTVGLLAVHPFTLWAATEVRVYSFGLFLTAAILMAEERQPPTSCGRSIRQSILIGSLWALSLYTHYYLGFLLMGIGIASVLTRSRKELVALAIKTATCGFAFFPMLRIVSGQVGTVSAIHGAAPALEALLRVYGIGKEFVLPSLDILSAGAGRAIGIMAVLLWLGAVGSHLRSVPKEHMRLWITTVVVALCYSLTGVVVGSVATSPRHAFVLFPLVILSVLSAVAVIGNGHRSSRSGWVAIGVLGIGFILGTVIDFRPLAKEGDYRRASELIERLESPGEPIAMYHAETVLPMEYYYQGDNRLIPIPTRPSLQRFNELDFVIESPASVGTAIAGSGSPPEVLWLFDTGIIGSGTVEYNHAYLDEYIHEHYGIDRTYELRGATLQRLAAKHNTAK
jgi:hypothetical protein